MVIKDNQMSTNPLGHGIGHKYCTLYTVNLNVCFFLISDSFVVLKSMLGLLIE